MRIYHHPISSNARRVAMLVAHLQCEVEFVEVNLMSAEDRRSSGSVSYTHLTLPTKA